MTFGLTSLPSSFQRLLNHILKPHDNPFVLVYLDDVLIFSNNLEEHVEHIDKVLTLLNDNSIRLRLSKCLFAKNELEYLGHIVSGEGLKPTNSKIKAATEWPTPKSVQKYNNGSAFEFFIGDTQGTTLTL